MYTQNRNSKSNINFFTKPRGIRRVNEVRFDPYFYTTKNPYTHILDLEISESFWKWQKSYISVQKIVQFSDSKSTLILSAYYAWKIENNEDDEVKSLNILFGWWLYLVECTDVKFNDQKSKLLKWWVL